MNLPDSHSQASLQAMGKSLLWSSYGSAVSGMSCQKDSWQSGLLSSRHVSGPAQISFRQHVLDCAKWFEDRFFFRPFPPIDSHEPFSHISVANVISPLLIPSGVAHSPDTLVVKFLELVQKVLSHRPALRSVKQNRHDNNLVYRCFHRHFHCSCSKYVPH